jgi:uncharacterized protein (TIGR03086 family)
VHRLVVAVTGLDTLGIVSEVADRYEVIAAGFTARVAGVPPDRWAAPSPCPGWTASDVVAHVTDAHHRVLAMLGRSQPVLVAGGDDAAARWTAATEAMLAAVSDQQQSPMAIGTMFGDMPFEWLVNRLICADTLIHTWDLARATGQDERLEATAVAKVTELLTPSDETIRRPGGFGPKIEPAPEADAQTRLLNFCGRAA